MTFASSSFGVVHYRSAGPAHAPAIILGHALGTDSRIWNGVVDELSRDYGVIAYDLRGHGLSSVPQPPYRLDQLAADVLDLADHLSLDRFALAGVSVGGLVAQRFALDHPDRLAGLVLCNTAARIGDDALWNARIGAVEAGGLEAIADGVLMRWFPAALREGRQDEIAGWRNMLLRSPVPGYVGTCAALRDADLTAEIAGIAMPTLVVAGEDDQSTPVALVRGTAKRLPAAQFEIIARAGHLPCIDRPDELARLMRGYLAEVGHG